MSGSVPACECVIVCACLQTMNCSRVTFMAIGDRCFTVTFRMGLNSGGGGGGGGGGKLPYSVLEFLERKKKKSGMKILERKK